jgi:hypothetical protein
MGAMGWITYPELQPDPEHPSCGWVKVTDPGNRAQGCLSGARRGSRIGAGQVFLGKNRAGQNASWMEGRKAGRRRNRD